MVGNCDKEEETIKGGRRGIARKIREGHELRIIILNPLPLRLKKKVKEIVTE